MSITLWACSGVEPFEITWVFEVMMAFVAGALSVLWMGGHLLCDGSGLCILFVR